MSCKQVIYFHNGSIGDFLMVLHLMENIHANEPDLPVAIAVPRNLELCRELAERYPYIDVFTANKSTAANLFFKYMKGGNYVITPPTPGRLPLATKLVAKTLAVFPGERLIGFDDGALVNRFLYDQLLPYDTSKLYYETMHDIVRTLGFDVLVLEPTFSFSRQPGVFERFSLLPHHYLVVHPFGSSDGRSVLGTELRDLIKTVRERFDGAIVLSGSAADYKQHQHTVGSLVEEYAVIPILGAVSILELATILQDADGYIGVDTGISHLASLLRVRSLILAHNGTPNWLPYYNENSRIIYCVDSDTSGIHEGRTHLESKRNGRTHYLDRIPQPVVVEATSSFLKQ